MSNKTIVTLQHIQAVVIQCRRQYVVAGEWMNVNQSWVWLLLLLRLVGGVLPLLGDAIQRRVNSIAGDRDDSNSSLVRREFGRRLAAARVRCAHTVVYMHRVSFGHSRELLSLRANMILSQRISAIGV